ncbi:cupin [Pseudomonas sp. MPC6]|uniref:cupin n=1 Tax=unclassified Pseudomonas TaxID=196821 RepID=UPI001110A3AD|nr:cupin [Pseudomonas sp. MPC6]QCY13215.1 cupin [Pseudomonas sp. MPC6]
MANSQAVATPAQPLLLERNGWVPNNPRLPVLIYPKAIAVQGSDPAALFEKIFNANGWPPQWRYGVYNYHHYHTEGHEVLGIGSGHARLMLGGPLGHVLEVGPGDVLLLPAGTGHCNLESSDDFLVVGAYPPGQHADICREAPTAAQLASIDALPIPHRDPVQGVDGAVGQYWVSQRQQ